MQVTCVGEPLARVHADVLVIGFFEDIRPLKGLAGQVDWLAKGALSRLIMSRRATGQLKEATLLALDTFSTPRILCMGLGKLSAYTYWTLHQTAELLIPMLRELRVGCAAVELLGVHGTSLDPAVAARTFVKAWYEGPSKHSIDLAFVLPKQMQPSQFERQLRDMGIS